MRRVLALNLCCAVMLAFGLAPFQHVHADHDHEQLVHAHFYAIAHTHDDSPGVHFDDVDDHGSVRSLDTFAPALAKTIAPFVLPRGVTVDPPAPIELTPVDTVEACAHDPPASGPSIPRAPPA